MIIETDFPKPIPSFQFPVQLVLPDPDSAPYVCVRFNRAWLPYVLGSLLQLALISTWDTDDEDALNAQLQRATDLIYLFQSKNSQCVPNVPHIYEEIDEMPAFRVDCDCNVFVTCCDGTEVQLAKLSDVPTTSKQPSDAPQPAPGGGVQKYCFTLDTSKQYLLPVVVNTGDIINVTSVTGGAYDGSGIFWFCPNGKDYFASKCIGLQTPALSGDPVTSAHHMTPVAKIGSSYYSLETSLTVPSGVSNQQVLIQVNDSILTDNTGDYDFCIQVTNNQAVAPGCENYNFAFVDGGFVPKVGGGGNEAAYIPGQGWETTDTDLGGGNFQRRVCIDRTYPSGTHFSSIDFVYDYVPGGGTSGGDDALEISVDGTVLFSIHFSDMVSGTNQVATWHGSHIGSVLEFLVTASDSFSPGYAGSATIKTTQICH